MGEGRVRCADVTRSAGRDSARQSGRFLLAALEARAVQWARGPCLGRRGRGVVARAFVVSGASVSCSLRVFPPGSLLSPSRAPFGCVPCPSVSLPSFPLPRLPPKPPPAAPGAPLVPVSRLPRLASSAHALRENLSDQGLAPQLEVRAAAKGEAGGCKRFCHLYCLSRPFSVAVENGNVEMCNVCEAGEVFSFSSVTEGAELLWLFLCQTRLWLPKTGKGGHLPSAFPSCWLCVPLMAVRKPSGCLCSAHGQPGQWRPKLCPWRQLCMQDGLHGK